MTSPSLEHDLRAAIRSIPDYPKPGIMFRDITTLLGDARAFRRAVDELVQPWAGMKIDKVAGIEARGFILGGAVAHLVSAGFIPIRKKGKLPHKRVSIAYSLEYGLDEMEVHEDAVSKGERVILVDDLIATGGTAEGAVKLLRQLGANILAACFVIDCDGALLRAFWQWLTWCGHKVIALDPNGLTKSFFGGLRGRWNPIRGEFDAALMRGGPGAVKLLRQMGAEVLAACFVIDLPELGGAAKLRAMNVPVRTLVSFEGH